MGKMSRNKGKRSELILVHFIRDFYGYEVRRGDCFRGEADVIGLPGIWIEVKAHEKVDIGTWYWQAWETTTKRDGGIPVVFHKINRSPWYVTLAVKDYEIMGGESAPMDERVRFNLMNEMKDHDRIRYYRQGLDLITVKAEEFMDVYGGYIHDREMGNHAVCE